MDKFLVKVFLLTVLVTQGWSQDPAPAPEPAPEPTPEPVPEPAPEPAPEAAPTLIVPTYAELPTIAPSGGVVVTLRPNDMIKLTNPFFRRRSSGGRGLFGPEAIWQFQAKQCNIEMYCFCLEIPASWNCLKGYLRIDTGSERQKFCGGNAPQSYVTGSGTLLIKFRPNLEDPYTRLDRCLVRCNPPAPGIVTPWPATGVPCP